VLGTRLCGIIFLFGCRAGDGWCLVGASPHRLEPAAIGGMVLCPLPVRLRSVLPGSARRPDRAIRSPPGTIPVFAGGYLCSHPRGRHAGQPAAGGHPPGIDQPARGHLRPGEEVALDAGDVDLDAALATVRGKYDRTRLVPLHPTTVTMLRQYRRRCRQLCPAPSSPSFVLSPAGTRLSVGRVDAVFATATRNARLTAIRALLALAAQTGPRVSELTGPPRQPRPSGQRTARLLPWERPPRPVHSARPLSAR
jgi:hypothetical protein